MKALFTLILILVSNAAIPQEIKLEKSGKPVYRKQRDNDLGIAVYKNGSNSVATILPREYFVLGEYNDTLELKISKSKTAKTGFKAECSNCTNIRFEQLETEKGSQFKLSDRDDYVLFNINYERSPSDLRIAPQETSFARDNEIGYIRLQNTLIHYNSIPGKSGYTIAIADMNHNGRADSSDYICLSTDEFFYTARRDRSKKIAEVTTIEIDHQSYTYQLTDAQNFSISLYPTGADQKADLFIQKQLENLNFGETDLYSLLTASSQVLITHWTEYSKPCTNALPDVIELNETVPVVALHTGNKDLEYINHRYGIEYISLQSTEELENKLNLSGYPHYLIVGENKEILLDTNDIEEVKSFLAE